MSERSENSGDEAQLLIGVTHEVKIGNVVEGRVYVDGTPANPTEHWMLRPSFRAPADSNSPDMVVHAVTSGETLNDLFRWGRLIPNTKYIRAACTTLPIPAA